MDTMPRLFQLLMGFLPHPSKFSQGFLIPFNLLLLQREATPNGNLRYI